MSRVRLVLYIFIGVLVMLFLVFGDRIGRSANCSPQSDLACTNRNHTGGVAPVTFLPTGLPTSSPVAPPEIPSGAVPWADRPPAPLTLRPRPPTTLPATSTQPCRASQLTVIDGGGNGAGGHTEYLYRFVNASATTCLLGGHPQVVASEPGHADVVATDGTFFGDGGPPGDIGPNQSGTLTIQTESACTAHPGGASGVPYHHVVVTLPGGGNLAIPNASFDVVCGLQVAAFAWPVPSPVEPPDPIAALTVTLAAPQRLLAGTTAVYTVMLANPTDAAVPLDPCPNFIQVLEAPMVKDLHQLNCAEAKPIPPHGQEFFVMHLVVPDDAASGQTTLHWNLAAGPDAHASTMVEVQADPHRPA